MKSAPRQSGVEGLPLFEIKPRIKMFAPSSDVREDLGYSPRPKRVREEFLSADDKRDEDLNFRSLADHHEGLMVGLPENQRPATAEELEDFFGTLKRYLAD